MEDNMNVENVEKWNEETEEKVTWKERAGKAWKITKPYLVGGVLGAGGLLLLAVLSTGGEDDQEVLGVSDGESDVEGTIELTQVGGNFVATVVEEPKED